MSVSSATRRQKEARDRSGFETSMVYIVSSRKDKATKWDPAFEKSICKTRISNHLNLPRNYLVTTSKPSLLSPINRGRCLPQPPSRGSFSSFIIAGIGAEESRLLDSSVSAVITAQTSGLATKNRQPSRVLPPLQSQRPVNLTVNFRQPLEGWGSSLHNWVY